MKNKGFTLIELLAVIIILGILMLIAIPSVTSYINNSRKETYVDTIKEVLRGASVLVNSGELEANDPNTTYYVPVEAIKTENGDPRSPYGKFTDAYVVITYDGDEYDYYFVGKDEADMGTDLITKEEKLDKESIDSVSGNIPDDVGVGPRDKVVIYNKDKEVKETKNTTTTVNPETGKNPVEYPEGKNKQTVANGSIVKIGDEEFYALYKSNGRLILLAKYNLKVGGIYESHIKKVGEYLPGDEGYGLQSPEAIGQNNDSTPYYGVVPFSATPYWAGKAGEGLEYPGTYCSGSEPASSCPEVYDENSSLYPYINNYKNYIEKMGVKVYEARIMSRYEIQNYWKSSFYPTSFWLSSAYTDTGLWVKMAFTHAGVKSEGYSSNYNTGVRPVIVI